MCILPVNGTVNDLPVHITITPLVNMGTTPTGDIGGGGNVLRISRMGMENDNGDQR